MSTERKRRLIITDLLTMAPNAKIRQRKGNDYIEIDLAELARLDFTNLHQSLTTTKTVLASETGTHFILNSATAFVTTLPAAAAGLEYFFHIGATEPTTSHTVVTASSANIMVGNVTSMALTAAGPSVFAADSDTITFAASKALHGDYVHLYCDGTNWMVDGMCSAFDGIVGSQAS